MECDALFDLCRKELAAQGLERVLSDCNTLDEIVHRLIDFCKDIQIQLHLTDSTIVEEELGLAYTVAKLSLIIPPQPRWPKLEELP